MPHPTITPTNIPFRSDAIDAMLRLATFKFGPRLIVHGTATFKAQVAAVAASSGLTVKFTDRDVNQFYKHMKAVGAHLDDWHLHKKLRRLASRITTDSTDSEEPANAIEGANGIVRDPELTPEEFAEKHQFTWMERR